MKRLFFPKGTFFLTGLIILLSLNVSCQNMNPNDRDNAAAAGGYNKLEEWKVYNRTISLTKYKGRSAFQLSEGTGAGFAVMNDYVFKDGVIELEIAAVPFFTGIVFRVQSNKKYEAIYFRPQNSHHDDPVKRSHTVQYISPPDNTWQHLREKFPGKYEAWTDLEEEEWFRVKVVIEGVKADVFVNESDKPCLTIDSLLHGTTEGKVGIWCGNTSGGTYTGFTVSENHANDSTIIESGFNDYQDYLFDIFDSRRSIRGYKSYDIPDEHIRRIIQAAGTAPTAGNQQPWKFLVIKDRNKIGKLRELQLESELKIRKMKKDQDIDQVRNTIMETLNKYLSAPVFITVLTDDNSRYPSYNIKDGSIAAGYVLIAARALGYGSVLTTNSFSPDNIKKAFDIPDNYSQICFIPIGIPIEWTDSPSKKNLDQIMVWENFEKNMSISITNIISDEINTSEYIGKYDYKGEVVLDIIVVSNELCMKSTGYEPVPLSMEGKDHFTVAGTDYHIYFIRNDDRSIEGIRAIQGDSVFFAGKIE